MFSMQLQGEILKLNQHSNLLLMKKGGCGGKENTKFDNLFHLNV